MTLSADLYGTQRGRLTVENAKDSKETTTKGSVNDANRRLIGYPKRQIDNRRTIDSKDTTTEKIC